MWDFLGSIFNKVISAVASVIIAVGIVSVSEPVDIQPPQIIPREEIIFEEIQETGGEELVQEEMVEKKPEIEELKREVEELKKIQEKTSSSDSQKVSPTVKKIGLPKQPEIKTFTLPNGAVIDEAGNVISGPTKATPSVTDTNITAGTKILSGEEIYSLVSPSVVLIESSGGHGTGFVVENGKYTITNAHVVGSDSEVKMTFQNGVSISGPVLGKIGSDDDIALIYNNNLSLKAVTFGLSDNSNLKTGADVYALGFPLIYTNTITLTKGLVSANRQQTSSGSLIQTDASIHPGNSGGPLVNNKGEVVGVNTSGVVAQGSVVTIGGTGIGFAIPIETVKSLIPSLSKYGQSRYELYPIGITLTIKRSLAIKIVYNDHLPCSQLQLTADELTLCGLYKDHYEDYHWEIID